MGIILSFLCGAVALSILMHLHFKTASDVRIALVSPPVFAVIGALVGISLGLWLVQNGTSTPWETQVSIDESVPRALAGAAVGGLVGIGAMVLFGRLAGRARVLGVVLTLMLLGASIGAPTGWLYIGTYYNDVVMTVGEAEQLTRRGMGWGAAIGCSVGLVLGLLEACFGRRHRTEAAAVPSSEHAGDP